MNGCALCTRCRLLANFLATAQLAVSLSASSQFPLALRSRAQCRRLPSYKQALLGGADHGFHPYGRRREISGRVLATLLETAPATSGHCMSPLKLRMLLDVL